MKHFFIPLTLFVLFWIVMFAGAVITGTAPFTHRPIPLQIAPAAVPTSPSPAAPQPFTVLFVGDMMFDRDIRQRMQQYGAEHILANVEPLLHQHDIVVGNLEGPITSHASKSMGSAVGSTANFIFTFDPIVPVTLKKQGFDIVNLGNNHILNFGTAGVTSSKEYLRQAELLFFGDTTTERSPAERTLITTHEGVKLGFANYNQFVNNGYENALADMAFLRPHVDVLIVYTHWGNEYVPTANAAIEEQAFSFVDAGADVVIGSHPHVIQNDTEYKGKKIYYSLGNFVFDQYFSNEVKKGQIVIMTVDPQTKHLSFSERYVQLQHNGQTVLLPD